MRRPFLKGGPPPEDWLLWALYAAGCVAGAVVFLGSAVMFAYLVYKTVAP